MRTVLVYFLLTSVLLLSQYFLVKKKKVDVAQNVLGMEDDTGTDDKTAVDDFDEDLLTLLYLLVVLVCVLMGESVYWCLYVVLILNAAEVLCNL